MTCIADILEVSKSLLTPALAVIGTTILVLQYRLGSLRWKLDLYDKRYPVYTATMDFIASIMRDGNVDDERLFKFLRESKDKEFLFGKDVREHIETLYKKGVDLRFHSTSIEPLPVGEKRSKHAEEIKNLMNWYGEQFEQTKNKFGVYLKIEKK